MTYHFESPFDVRCPRCGETGSEKRMDIKGVCFYCREEIAEAKRTTPK